MSRHRMPGVTTRLLVLSVILAFVAAACSGGGGVSQAWEMFIDRALAELKRRALRAPAERVKVMKSVLGDDEGIIGAAYLALNVGKEL